MAEHDCTACIFSPIRTVNKSQALHLYCSPVTGVSPYHYDGEDKKNYCDQNDRELRRVHAAFLNERMDDNERVLRDFENLIIEVTQMDDGLPMNAPTLDVLASTLRSVRTGDCLPADGGVLYMKGEMK